MRKALSDLNVVLIHDWLTGMRGGEKVLEQFCLMFPNAPLYTLFHFKGEVSPLIEDRAIVASPLQKLADNIPGVAARYRHLLPLFPWAIEQLQLPAGTDLVLSTSHCVARGVLPPPGAHHLSYVHTPMRYVYEQFDQYFGPGRTGPLTRAVAKGAAHYLRLWDEGTQGRVDSYVANSHHVQKRITRRYRRPSEVVHPPVELDRFQPTPRDARQPYYLMVGAMAPYKNVDIAVEAFTALGLPLKVVGDGQDMERIRGLAGPNVELLGRCSNAEITALYARARAFVFPGEEDFGITPLEAQASGTPVIALGRGGALETVRGEGPDATGVFFGEPTVGALMHAVRAFEHDRPDLAMPVDRLVAWAATFAEARFRRQMGQVIERALGAPMHQTEPRLSVVGSGARG